MVKEICESAQIYHSTLYLNLKALIRMYDKHPERFQKTFTQDGRT